MHCPLCEQVAGLQNVRFYYECDGFVIIENQVTSTPLLLARRHIEKVPVEAFQWLNHVASKLFGNDYCFMPSLKGHFFIKTFRLREV